MNIIQSILWMSPIYAITSFLSLVLPSGEPYLSIVKDFYESYVIYQFLSFLIAVLGKGDRNAVVRTLARHVEHLKAPFRCLHCLFHPPPEESDEAMANAVLMECQVLAMQFVFFRPLTAIIMFVLEATGTGSNGNGWSYFYSPMFVVVMIENVSVFLAFSGLLKFYHAVRDDLSWCQPFAKFLTIKGVVFMTFWQGLLIAIIFHASSESEEEDTSNSAYSAISIQHILICMEMLFFSAAHWCVFPAEEWEEGYKARFYEGPGFGFKDFASDIQTIYHSSKRANQARRDKRSDLLEESNSSSAIDHRTNGDATTSAASFGTMNKIGDGFCDNNDNSVV